jgi:hypothetical protein
MRTLAIILYAGIMFAAASASGAEAPQKNFSKESKAPVKSPIIMCAYHC